MDLTYENGGLSTLLALLLTQNKNCIFAGGRGEDRVEFARVSKLFAARTSAKYLSKISI